MIILVQQILLLEHHSTSSSLVGLIHHVQLSLESILLILRSGRVLWIMVWLCVALVRSLLRVRLSHCVWFRVRGISVRVESVGIASSAKILDVRTYVTPG